MGYIEPGEVVRHSDLNSDAIQNVLDRVAQSGPQTPAAGVTRQVTPFGTASVRFDREADGKETDPGASAPIMSDDGKTQIGVGRASGFNYDDARRGLYAAYPEAFQKGTPENTAFTNAANDKGEQYAHENAQSILGPIAAARAGTGSAPVAGSPVSYTNSAGKTVTVPGAIPGGNAAASRGDLSAPGSTNAVISQNAVDANTNAPGALVDKFSPIGRAVNYISSIPGKIADTTGGIVNGALNAVGLAPTGRALAGAVTSGLAPIASAVSNVGKIAGSLTNPLLDGGAGVVHGLTDLFKKTDSSQIAGTTPPAPSSPPPVNDAQQNPQPQPAQNTLGNL